MRHPCQLIVASLAVLLLALPAGADLVPAGQKKVRRDAVIDFGPYADYSTWTYVVKKGDTLSEIAEHHLGTLKRHAEITKLNPGLTSDTLKANDKILMPPRKPPLPIKGTKSEPAKPRAAARMWWTFYGARWSGMGGFELVSHGDKLPHHHYWTTLFAVRHDHQGTFEKAMKDAGRDKRTKLEALQKEDWFVVAKEQLTGYTSLSTSSPIAHVVDRYRIEGIAKGQIRLKLLRTENFDKDREPVSGAGLLGGGWNLLLIFLAFAGLLGLVFVASRRARVSRVKIPVSS